MIALTASPAFRPSLFGRAASDRGDDLEVADAHDHLGHDVAKLHRDDRRWQLVSCAEHAGGSLCDDALELRLPGSTITRRIGFGQGKRDPGDPAFALCHHRGFGRTDEVRKADTASFAAGSNPCRVH